MEHVTPPLPLRESACPVHFVWDSPGLGRWGVRLGFLGFLGAGMLMTAARMVHVDALRAAAGALAGVSAAAWILGHALTRLQRLRRR